MHRHLERVVKLPGLANGNAIAWTVPATVVRATLRVAWWTNPNGLPLNGVLAVAGCRISSVEVPRFGSIQQDLNVVVYPGEEFSYAVSGAGAAGADLIVSASLLDN